MTLKGYSKYTTEGCINECVAEEIVKACGCRMPGYSGRSEVHYSAIHRKFLPFVGGCLYCNHLTEQYLNILDGYKGILRFLHAVSVCLFLCLVFFSKKPSIEDETGIVDERVPHTVVELSRLEIPN